MTRPRLTLIILAGLLLSLLGTAIIVASLPPPVPVEPATGAASALSAADLRFYRAVRPVLRAAAGEARALTTQGEERSRNLFAIRAGQSRLQEHLTTLDALFAEAPTSSRFDPVVDLYRAGATEARAAMRRAEAAFLRFDWDEVGTATELMAASTAQLEAAAADLDAATGATPVAAAGS